MADQKRQLEETRRRRQETEKDKTRYATRSCSHQTQIVVEIGNEESETFAQPDSFFPATATARASFERPDIPSDPTLQCTKRFCHDPIDDGQQQGDKGIQARHGDQKEKCLGDDAVHTFSTRAQAVPGPTGTLHMAASKQGMRTLKNTAHRDAPGGGPMRHQLPRIPRVRVSS
ncbi:hypothetical protein A1F97_07872 [Pyrenophora tritici-repentis]|uniref:Uncharacterized protein n=1 Tax=Pyrenophora tritici-repentis TaxID=45151 RepID=A0A2W1GXE3_9PLEO|nr:hypothetical protein Ptr86124_011436 [Pyrenophora tritici-repentis]KAI1677596.1 hypothetical protein KJE20_12532 [Pyrenophora tritici-repentis]PZC92492.1 hypothetical protein A1F95_08005 [Pyrenophora tritici-repentis]PZD37124.1 hypothetical protein A1F97_07872 [Pyrenophora tritici-repentis]